MSDGTKSERRIGNQPDGGNEDQAGLSDSVFDRPTMAILAALILGYSTEHALSQTKEITAAPLNLLWSQIVPYDWPPAQEEKGLVLVDILRSPDSLKAILANADGRPSLLLDADESGPGRSIPLPLGGKDLHIAGNGSGGYWIGGEINRHMIGIAPHYVSDGYLAKISATGNAIWEHRFGNRNERSIQSLAGLPSGEVVVSGRNDDATWLAKISEGGEVLWEKFFGVAKGSSVIAVGELIFVAAFSATHESDFYKYQDDLSLWIFDGAGTLVERRVIRNAINRKSSSAFGKIFLQSEGDDIYLSSLWSDSFGAIKSTEVVKLDREGKTIWQKEVLDTSPPSSGPATIGLPSNCTNGMAIISPGDPVILCGKKGATVLFRLSSKTGEVTKIVVPHSHSGCQSNASPALFLARKNEQTVFILGSRRGHFGESCTWMGEVFGEAWK